MDSWAQPQCAFRNPPQITTPDPIESRQGLYSLLQPFFDKKWRPGQIEVVNADRVEVKTGQ